MTKLEAILEMLGDDTDALKADGFEDAALGICFDIPTGASRIIYSYAKCVDVLMTRDGMDYEEAVEFMEHNVIGAYMGPGTPIFMEEPNDE